MAAKEMKGSRNSIIDGKLVNFFLAGLAIALWSFWPALCAMTAALRLPGIKASIIASASEQQQLEMQRNVQKHFLIYGVYIPLEDIFFTQRISESNKDLEGSLRRACGNGRFALWLPLVVRIPLVGERSSEWCWNIMSKKSE